MPEDLLAGPSKAHLLDLLPELVQQGAFITEWNERHGDRFVLHYTPTHGSWLNQVELWFCIVSHRILRYGNFHSPDQLIAAIRAFIREWNETEAHPFRWTYEGLPRVR